MRNEEPDYRPLKIVIRGFMFYIFFLLKNMFKKVVLAVLLASCVKIGLARPIELENEITWNVFVDMVEHVPKPDQYKFVRNNYLQGYDVAHEEHIDIDEMVNPDCRLALGIFKVVSEWSSQSEAQVRALFIRRDPICFPLPIGCIDTGDPGIRPI